MKNVILAAMLLFSASCANMIKKNETVTLFDGNKKMTVVTADSPSKPEKTACRELTDYLKKVTGKQFKAVKESEFKEKKPAIYLGWTKFAREHGINFSKLGKEEWIIKTTDGSLILTGGRPRGTLYSVYHFLEDKVGVRWWTPYEEFTPRLGKLEFTDLDLRGKPVFVYRDIYLIPGRKGAAFKSRNRLNVHMPEYGGQILFGGTRNCHTLYAFMEDIKKAYKEHPEWFPLINGKRKFDSSRPNGGAQTQLCLSSPELRKYFVERIRGFIKADRQKAKKNGLQPPMFYAIDQNDCYDGFCQCEKCMEIIKREGSTSGLMLDFTNYIADKLKDEAPGVTFLMLAEHVLETPPKHLKALPNVGVRLCDTTSNMICPWTSPDNQRQRRNIDGWSKVTDKIAIWEYQITYGNNITDINLPLPNTHTFAPDMRYLAEHNGIGIFFEHEQLVGGDMRDLNVWIETKLVENPYLDYQALLKDFTDGYYGPAGMKVRDYLSLLENCSKKSGAKITYFPSLSSYTYLDYDFIMRANQIFKEASEQVKDDPVLSERLAAARLALDHATLITINSLKRKWKKEGKKTEDSPIDYNKTLARYKKTWLSLRDRLEHPRLKAREGKSLNEFLDGLSKRKELPVPAQFKGVPKERLFDFNASMFSKWINYCKLVKDTDSAAGIAFKVSIADVLKENRKGYTVDKFKVPFKWAVWPTMQGGPIKGKTDVRFPVNPGYNWYKLKSDIQLIKTSRAAWFAGIGVSLKGVVADNQELGQEYEIWISMKFDGPAYSKEGMPGKDNSIYMDRVIVIQKTSNSGN